MDEHDAVYKPSHYEKDGYPSMQEVVRGMFAGTEGDLPLSVYPWWKDAFKYIYRWPLKGDTWEECIQDLNKAKRCIDMIIEELESNNVIVPTTVPEKAWTPACDKDGKPIVLECENVDKEPENGFFTCSMCGCTVHDAEDYYVSIMDKDLETIQWQYCPCCGRRVVNDD